MQPRGNIESELNPLKQKLRTEIEVYNTGILKLKETLERLLKRGWKQLPFIGRPRLTNEERLNRKKAKELKKGQFQIWK